MNRPEAWRACAGAFLIVVVLAMCLPALADATLSARPECAAVKGEQLSASKASPPNLWAVPVGDSTFVPAVSASGCLPPDPTLARVSADLWGDRSPRAPPVQL